MTRRDGGYAPAMSGTDAFACEDNLANDPVLLRGITQRRGRGVGRRLATAPGYSRREALAFGGLAAAGLGLAACGVSGAGNAVSTSQPRSAAEKFWAGQKKHGQVDIASWPSG